MSLFHSYIGYAKIWLNNSFRVSIFYIDFCMTYYYNMAFYKYLPEFGFFKGNPTCTMVGFKLQGQNFI